MYLYVFVVKIGADYVRRYLCPHIRATANLDQGQSGGDYFNQATHGGLLHITGHGSPIFDNVSCRIPDFFIADQCDP
jgi:hypothetical protein